MTPAPLLADLRQQEPIVGVVVDRVDRAELTMRSGAAS